MTVVETSTRGAAADHRGWFVTIARQALLIVAGFGVYLGARALANGSEAAAYRHAARLLEIEAALGIDIERRFQAAVLDEPAIVGFFNFVYVCTYWPFVIGTFVVTYLRRLDVFVLYRNAISISGAVGLAVFIMVPVAPPRFLNGFVDTVDQSNRSTIIGRPDGLINEFAALPSFHVGWVTLASAVLFIGTKRRWLRAALLVPPLLMAVAVVLTANHYVLDIVAGVGVSMASLWVARQHSMRRGSQSRLSWRRCSTR